MTNPSLHVACPHCNKTNRVPTDKLVDDPVCGACGLPLLDGKPIELTDETFELVASRTEIPLIVDFWAPWCGPCRMMAPQFDQAAKTLKGRALLAKVNSDESPKVSQRFAIRSIPTLIRFDKGVEAGRQTGATQAAQIVAFAHTT
ncbi:MAG: thioredoxin TrxC [Burkholderiaceae bacterium]